MPRQAHKTAGTNQVLPFARRAKTSRGRRLGTFIDLFCGIGGFHIAASNLGLDCVFASDIDTDACEIYERNFGLYPQGDITKIDVSSIPKHDILFAGIPCQPFSIIGNRKALKDSRGNLFLEVARVAAAKCPRVVVIENVRQFATIDGGRPLARVIKTFETMGYTVDWRILNALDFGVPQKRERIIIVAMRDGQFLDWPEGGVPMKPLKAILEKKPAQRHYASERIRRSRHQRHTARVKPSIWHENKAGNVSSHPFSCALRAGASYNYLLVNGERRLTPRELFRLQGFPDSFVIPEMDSIARRLSGNAVPVPMVQAVMESILAQYGQQKTALAG